MEKRCYALRCKETRRFCAQLLHLDRAGPAALPDPASLARIEVRTIIGGAAQGAPEVFVDGEAVFVDGPDAALVGESEPAQHDSLAEQSIGAARAST